MRSLTILAVVTPLVVVAACVWTPNDRSNAESTGVTLSGFTFSPSEEISLSAKNLTTGVTSVVATAKTGTGAIAIDGQNLYAWSTTLTTKPDFWAPQINAAGGLPNSLGRIEIFPTLTDGGEPLVSFTAAQQTCMNANMNSEGVVSAASQCGDSDSLVLFDNDGVATAAPTAGFSTVVSGSFPTVSPKVSWELVSYPVNIGTSAITVYGYVCTPTASGTYPVQIYNHPGWLGLSGSVPPAAPPLAEDDLGNCIQGAENGWVTAMSAYRGEPVVYGTGYYGYDPSDIETCLGEATDVLRFTNLVLQGPKVNTSHVFMWGWSHGGCVTDRAVEQAAPVQAAATFSAMTDLLAMGESICGPSNPSCNWPFGPVPGTFPGWGLTPSADAIAYDWRSPVYFPADLNARTDVKMLAIQGVEEFDVGGTEVYGDGVLQTGAACELANVESPASTNAYLYTNGLTVGGEPPDCSSYPGLTWASASGGPAGSGWTWGNRTLLEVWNAGHFSVVTQPAIWTDFMSFVSSLGWGAAPYSNSYVWKSSNTTLP
jgi:hypothetical protein